MDEKTHILLMEIRQNIIDLSGDIIAPEAFCRHRGLLRQQWGSGAYLRRMEDHTRQHIAEISHLADILLQKAAAAPEKIPNKIPVRTTKMQRTVL